jgi:glucan phosphoethanolaminetransferase (alkaline phosphatase superfamily)
MGKTDCPVNYGVLQKMSGLTNGLPIRRFGLLLAALISVCAYPVLFIYFYNIKELFFVQVFSPILIFVAVGIAAWLFFAILSGNMVKGAFIALLFMLIFMNYSLIDDRIRALVPDWRWWRIAPVFLFLFINLALALRVFVTRPEGNAGLAKITIALGLICLALTIFNAVSGIYTLARTPRAESRPVASNSLHEEDALTVSSVDKRPNFYFFIFDEYARQDVLKKYTGYDNTPFLKGLERKGFNISYSSFSSSVYTEVSIANSLYYSNKFKTKLETMAGIKRPPLLEIFKKAGYKTYALCPNYKIDEDLVDVVLKSATVLTALSIEKTVVAGSFIAYLQKDLNEALRADRLNQLKQAVAIVEEKTKKSKFLFFHFMGPHEPFIFDENGDPVAYENNHDWADTRNYSGQLCFLSKKINELAGIILEKDPHAVVLIQSDHGGRWFIGMQEKERIGCLNNLYLGGQHVDIEGLPALNTLRLALKHALGLKLEP